MPTSTMQIRSVLAEFASADLAGTAESEPFDVRVLRPSRTLIEKLVLLHTASCDPNPATLIRAARHYYDVYQLLGHPDVFDEIREVGIGILARDVVTYSAAAALAAEPRPRAGFAASPAFADGPHLANTRADYDTRVLRACCGPKLIARRSSHACSECEMQQPFYDPRARCVRELQHDRPTANASTSPVVDKNRLCGKTINLLAWTHNFSTEDTAGPRFGTHRQ